MDESVLAQVDDALRDHGQAISTEGLDGVLKGILEEGTKAADDEIPAAQATPAAEEEQLAPASSLDTALDAAAKSNFQFNLRGGVLGNLWARLLKSDGQLSAEYKACKGYAEQRDFRQRWCDKMWKDSVSKRTKTNTQSKSKIATGSFMPIEVLVKEQGGTKEALEGIKFFIRRLASGEIKDVARYIQVNEWTNRVELALPQKSWQEEQTEKFSIEEQAVRIEEQTEKFSIEEQTEKSRQEEQVTTPEPKKKAASGKKTGDKTKTNPPPTNPEEPDKKKGKDELAAKARSITNASNKLKSSLGLANTVLKNIEHDSNWAWLRKLDEVGELKTRVAELENEIRNHTFWQDVQMLAMGELKKHKPDTFHTEHAARLSPFLSEVDVIKKITDSIMRVQAAK